MTFTYCESVLPCFFDAIWTCLDMFSIHVLTRFRYKWSQMQKVFFTKFFLMFLELLTLKKKTFLPLNFSHRGSVVSFYSEDAKGMFINSLGIVPYLYTVFVRKIVLFILWKFYAYIFPKQKKTCSKKRKNFVKKNLHVYFKKLTTKTDIMKSKWIEK